MYTEFVGKKSSMSSKESFYFNFKQNLELQKYYIALSPSSYIRIFKLRTAEHKLPIETWRWDETDIADRKINVFLLLK